MHESTESYFGKIPNFTFNIRRKRNEIRTTNKEIFILNTIEKLIELSILKYMCVLKIEIDKTGSLYEKQYRFQKKKAHNNCTKKKGIRYGRRGQTNSKKTKKAIYNNQHF